MPNIRAARLLTFEIFSYQHTLIWTYMVIKLCSKMNDFSDMGDKKYLSRKKFEGNP